MITSLDIRNLATVDALHIDLDAGMSALTGETGVGKSILIDALNLCLGQRADSTLMRDKNAKTEVTVCFDISANELAQQCLENQELSTDECIVRRTLLVNGTSKAWINGVLVSLQQLQQLAQHLVTVHSQHAHQNLLKHSAHRLILDDYGKHDLAPLTEALIAYKDLCDQYDQLNVSDDSEHALEIMHNDLKSLEALAPEADEWASLSQKSKQQSQMFDLLHKIERVQAHIDGEQGAISMINASIQELNAFEQSFEQIQSINEMLYSAQSILSEGRSDLQHFIQKQELDEEALAQLEARIDAWYDLARKLHVMPELLVEKWQELQRSYEQLNNLQSTLAKLKNDQQRLLAQYQVTANDLHQQRVATAKQLQQSINHHLKKLGLSQSFEVRIEQALDRAPNPYGNDQITFYFQPNAGLQPQALNKIASGGELSRLSLAIAVSTAQTTQQPALIFDEVDVGIGGAISEVVGALLCDLSQNAQVIVITHQAQVAAKAQHHLKITKSQLAGTVTTSVDVLQGEQKTQEIARMIGGITITRQTLAHAKEILS